MRAEKRGQRACLPWNQSQLGVSGTEYCCRRILSPSHVARISVVSGRFAVIRLQQPAETLNANDLALVPFMLRRDDPAEPLVNPLMMIVLEILGQDVAELFFGEEDEMLETFLSDGPHESLRVGIQTRTTWGQFCRVHAGGIENGVEFLRIERIPVVDQVLLAGQEATLTANCVGSAGIGQLPVVSQTDGSLA
jgi:hypothetical protein